MRRNLVLWAPLLLAAVVLSVPRSAHAKMLKPDAVEGKCNESGGVYFPPKGGHSYGCLNPDGSGVVCGGAIKRCDSWPASTPARQRPRRARDLKMPEKVPAK